MYGTRNGLANNDKHSTAEWQPWATIVIARQHIGIGETRAETANKQWAANCEHTRGGMGNTWRRHGIPIIEIPWDPIMAHLGQVVIPHGWPAKHF